MANDLISRAALPIITVKHYDSTLGGVCDHKYVKIEDVRNAPAVDAVPVVRCKDCAEYQPWLPECGNICMRLGSYYGNTKPDDFCSYGRRKDAEVDG